MKTIVSFFDGSCEPVNPNGNIGIGVVIYEAENFTFERSPEQEKQVKTSYTSIKKIHEHSEHHLHGKSGFQITSNNMAEHLALWYALNYVKDIPYKNFYFFGDSKLVINQMKEIYSVNRSKIYAEAAMENFALLSSLKDKNINFEWIPREFNKIADELSNKKHTVKAIYSK